MSTSPTTYPDIKFGRKRKLSICRSGPTARTTICQHCLRQQDIETKAVLKACIAARAALAEVKVSGQLIPNQAVLINSIPLVEAQASSEIENISRRRIACFVSPMR